MKTKDVIIPASALFFTLLFYQQSPGINVLLFTVLFNSMVVYFYPHKRFDRTWLLFSFLTILSSASVFLVNSPLSVIATVFSVLILSNKSVSRSSTLVNLGFAFYSLARSPFDLLAGSYLNNIPVKEKTNKRQFAMVTTGVATSILIAVVFLMLYRNSNPLFNQYVTELKFEWVDLGWLFFTVFAFVLINGLIQSKEISPVSELDHKYRQPLVQPEHVNSSLSFDTVISVTVFSLLNIFLLVLNGLDIKSLYVTKQLPEGITLSGFVHDGVGALIFSIVVALGLIAWLLRGDLNFNRYGNLIRLLIYGWIIQNVLVVINTIMRNFWYIGEYQLTGLRIGVFIFLLLSLVGLYLTFIKVKEKKSAWWLASTNFHAWIVVLVFASPVNWDKQITRYNIAHAGAAKTLDTYYLINELGNANLPELVKLHNNNKLNKSERMALYIKLKRAYEKPELKNWPGFSLRRSDNNQALSDLEL